MGLGLAHIDECWDFVLSRAGRSGLHDGDLGAIRDRCLRGYAICLAGPDGVVIVAPRLLLDTMTLWVLLAVSASQGAFQRNESMMVKMAREIEAKRLIFHTKRRGWARILGPDWWFDGEFYTRSV